VCARTRVRVQVCTHVICIQSERESDRESKRERARGNEREREKAGERERERSRARENVSETKGEREKLLRVKIPIVAQYFSILRLVDHGQSVCLLVYVSVYMCLNVSFCLSFYLTVCLSYNW